MEKALKQEEIDALFARAKSRAKPDGPPQRLAPTPGVQPYNFARAGQINNEQMRAISILNDASLAR